MVNPSEVLDILIYRGEVECRFAKSSSKGGNSMVKNLLAGAALALLSGFVFAAERPNILFLLSDDHSYPFVSAYGDTNVKTPTLDKLAAEGMKFHRFFTACPQCVPSRAAYMTGRSPVAARMTRFTFLDNRYCTA